jgi:hypothetical protein
MFDSVEDGCATPEDAARGDIPPKFAIVAGLQISGDLATVWLLTNDQPPFEEYEVQCKREHGRWFADSGGGGFGSDTPADVLDRARELGNA